MSKETITHEIKLQPAVIVILGVMALGIVGNIFTKFSPIQDAKAFSTSIAQKMAIRVVDNRGNDTKICD